MVQRSGSPSHGAAPADAPERAAGAPRWRKASASREAECVEVASGRAGVLVRDSKDAAGPVIVLTRAAFAGLVADLREGAG
ncbi:DUF397 domain-containing protein [Actinomadura nitritigenes]|uniref:DUF397 domain-containing protein n=1 Tax=Actinomadura nitritigenes TaxID=134602 RepID=A0ABS3R5D8_9ACTN|nr:DUF397 domain-containing protein [Actinomadura nitritigenes]